jgi:uncharacterized protein YgiM (DUF1202 family)
MPTHSSRTLFPILLFFLTCVRPAEAATAFSPFVAEATEAAVNIRAGQSTNFERLCQLEKGEEVVVLDKEYSWFKVQLPAKAKVYISDKYVIKKRADQGQVSADKVNLRAGPEITYTIVGQAKEGQFVVIKEHKDGWYAIEPLEGNFGWVSEGLLRFKSATLPVVTSEELGPTETAAQAPEPKAAGTQTQSAADGMAGAFKSVTGVLKEQKDARLEGIYYKIDGDGQTYYIEGRHFSLESFLGFKVRAEGSIEQTSVNNTGNPLLKLTKIQLIL